MFDSQEEILMVSERLKKGKIGKTFESYMNKKELKKYFEENLMREVGNVQSSLSGQAADFYREFSNMENLWEMFRLNLEVNIFQKAFVIWYNDERDLDSVILSLITEENIILLMDFFIQNILEIGESLLKKEKEKNGFEQIWGESDKESSKKGKRAFVMPTDKKNSGILN